MNAVARTERNGRFRQAEFVMASINGDAIARGESGVTDQLHSHAIPFVGFERERLVVHGDNAVRFPHVVFEHHSGLPVLAVEVRPDGRAVSGRVQRWICRRDAARRAFIRAVRAGFLVETEIHFDDDIAEWMFAIKLQHRHVSASPVALDAIACLLPIRVGDLHGPTLGDRLPLAGVVRGRFEIVLEQELPLQRQLRVSVGSGDGDGESQRELNKARCGFFQ